MECRLYYREGEMKEVTRALRGHCMPGRKGAGLLREAGAQCRRMRKPWAWKEVEKTDYKYLYFKKQGRPRTPFLVRAASDCSGTYGSFWPDFFPWESGFLVWSVINYCELSPWGGAGTFQEATAFSPHLSSWVLATFGPRGWVATTSYPTQAHSSPTPVSAPPTHTFNLSGWGLPSSRSIFSVWIPAAASSSSGMKHHQPSPEFLNSSK